MPRNFYGFTNRNVPVVGEETFTPLPLPVAWNPLAPFITFSFE